MPVDGGDQLDVVVGSARLTIHRSGFLVGLAQGNDVITLTAREARTIAAIVTRWCPDGGPIGPSPGV